MTKNRTYYFPMEVFTREFYGKLALATELVSRNQKVIIGSNHLVRSLALEDKAHGCYYEIKGQSPSGMDYLYQLKNQGMIICGQDEEAGISYANFNDFKRFRPEVGNLKLYDAFFSWGIPDHKALIEVNPSANIIQTGSPRSLFWSDIGREFFAKEVELIEEKVQNYVLIISNTTIVNSILNKRESFRVTNEHGYSNDYHAAFEIRKKWEIEAHQTTVSVINTILENSDLQIVIRTHPVENILKWEETFSGNPRVKIFPDGPLSPLIFASKIVIHAGSTAGIESVIAQKKTISIESLIKANNFEMTATKISLQPRSIEELMLMLQDQYPMQEYPQDLLKYFVTNWGNLETLRKQCDQLMALHSIKRDVKAPVKHRESLYDRIYKRIRYGKSDYLAVHNKKRPRISHDQLERDLVRMSQLLQIDKKINVTPLGESTFQLEAK